MGKIVNEFAEKLQEEIQENKAIKDDWGVEVFEENGVVTLAGAVPSRETLDEVEAFVRKQDGVKAVVNELDIDSSLTESDGEINIDQKEYIPPTRGIPE